jgi:myo-inositol-1(or 4)-monophosphatase
MKYFIKELLINSGKLLKKHYLLRDSFTVKYKASKDIVTTADEEIENLIIKNIKRHYKDVSIISEEFNKDNISDFYNKKTFIIDPIDGTNNFVHKVPFFGISIAYAENGIIKAGGVFNPIIDELFIAETGAGAFLNGKKIFVSETENLEDSIAATGFACLRQNKKDNNLKNLMTILPMTKGVRRCGSAALDLCYVAAGRYDLFWEMNLNIWDIAAGIILVNEAGGIISDFNNEENYISKKMILVANNSLHSKCVSLFASTYE